MKKYYNYADTKSIITKHEWTHVGEEEGIAHVFRTLELMNAPKS